MLDAAQQRAARAAVDERHETEADRELQRVDREPSERLLGAAAAGGQRRGRRGRLQRGVLLAGMPLRTLQPIAPKIAADEQERQLRQARDEREQADRAGGDQRRLALAQDLVGDVAAEVAVGGRARDDDAGRDRDQQRRDLRGETVADGQQRELVRGFAEGEVVLEHRRRRCRRSRLIAVMITAAIASPLTNFEAPSIAP